VFEGEEKAREREQDPRRAEGRAIQELMAKVLAAPPEFTDLNMTADWVSQPARSAAAALLREPVHPRTPPYANWRLAGATGARCAVVTASTASTGGAACAASSIRPDDSACTMRGA
jgi:hypothetical protein